MEEQDKLEVSPENAPRFIEWLLKRGGIAIWRVIDLSRPGETASTPATTEDGKPMTRPGWAYDLTPERIITDAKDVNVVTRKEVRRFHVGVERGSGLSFQLTSAASRKVRDAVAKAGAGAAHHFDYEAQDAIITVPDKTVPLSDWRPEHASNESA